MHGYTVIRRLDDISELAGFIWITPKYTPAKMY